LIYLLQSKLMNEDLSGYLGYFSPYYVKKTGALFLSPCFHAAVSNLDASPTLDPAAIVSFINHRHMLGSQTLLREIRTVPWMAKAIRPGEGNHENWRYHDLAPHGDSKHEIRTIAHGLINRLKAELREISTGKTHILLPLSGGMDSRIIAGVLQALRQSGEIGAVVTAMTWGTADSRDVIYAERICRLLGWDWVCLPTTAQTFLDNIDLAAHLGGGISALHFHAIASARRLKGYDLVVAASYGDSIGRGVYSGRHVSKLRGMENLQNRFGLMRERVYRLHVMESRAEALSINQRFPRFHVWQQRELQKQGHYMAKGLNPCFAYLNEVMPVYQAFGNPSVFGYMWTFSQQMRRDEVYWHCLDIMNPDLLTIPWAKTGSRYLSMEKGDDLKAAHSDYHRWYIEGVGEYVEDCVLKGDIFELGFFNEKAVRELVNLARRMPVNNNAAVVAMELLLWLASLSRFIKLYNVDVGTDTQHLHDDVWSGVRARIEANYEYYRPLIGPTAIGRLISRK
jgi:hypothetical protein